MTGTVGSASPVVELPNPHLLLKVVMICLLVLFTLPGRVMYVDIGDAAEMLAHVLQKEL